jgi:hypothetical protein
MTTAWTGEVDWGYEDGDDARAAVRDHAERGIAARVVYDDDNDLYGVERGEFEDFDSITPA